LVFEGFCLTRNIQSVEFAGIRGVGFRMDESEGRGSRLKRYGPAADAGWTLSGSVIGCLLIGYMLGEYFDANPAALLIGLFTGIVAGMYNLAKIMWRKK